jgi:hypothetical protein
LAAGFEDELVRRVDALATRVVVAVRRRAALTAAVVAAIAAGLVFTVLPHEPATTPSVGRMVESHVTSSGPGDASRLAPAAVPASLGGP